MSATLQSEGEKTRPPNSGQYWGTKAGAVHELKFITATRQKVPLVREDASKQLCT